MAKKPKVLGNDPFRRGAAERTKPEEPAARVAGDDAPARAAPSRSRSKVASGGRAEAGKEKKGTAPKAGAAGAAKPRTGGGHGTAASGAASAESRGEGKARAAGAGAAKKGDGAKARAAGAGAAKKGGEAKARAAGAGAAKKGGGARARAAGAAKAGEAGADVGPTGPQAADVGAPEAGGASAATAPVEARPGAAREATSSREAAATAPAVASSEAGAADAAGKSGDPSTHPAAPAEAPRERHATGIDAIYASVIALRRLLHLPSAASGAMVDEFGKDADFEERVRPLLDWVYDRWFRVEVGGFDELPRDQPLILVANRAGAIPWDSLMLTIAAQRAGIPLRPLVEDSIFHFPSLGLLINRLGAIRASPENGERVLASGEAVAVFPEGATGFGKPYRERYRLQRFGRGGFIKLALRTGALVVPISIMGSEEIHPLLTRIELRPFGFPFLPITPTFPWLGPMGLIPFPSKWKIDARQPFDFREHGPEAAQDDPLVMRLAEEVRGTIQSMLDERLAARTSAFL